MPIDNREKAIEAMEKSFNLEVVFGGLASSYRDLDPVNEIQDNLNEAKEKLIDLCHLVFGVDEVEEIR